MHRRTASLRRDAVCESPPAAARSPSQSCAAISAGCDDDEAAYLDAWRGDAAARDAEAARLDDLLSDATQKKMKAERKLLAKLAKVSAKDEL